MNKSKENIEKKKNERKIETQNKSLFIINFVIIFISLTYIHSYCTHTCSTNVRLSEGEKKNRHSAYLFKLINKQAL